MQINYDFLVVTGDGWKRFTVPQRTIDRQPGVDLIDKLECIVFDNFDDVVGWEAVRRQSQDMIDAVTGDVLTRIRESLIHELGDEAHALLAGEAVDA